MNSRLLYASLALGLSTVFASAQNSAPVQSRVTTQVLGRADRLLIRLLGYPELSGEYRLGPEGDVTIAVIGRVNVSGLDAASLEKLLSDRITEITGKTGEATVEVIAYKPVFVTGLVENSGAVPWQPGLTVLQAVALAGGLVQPSSKLNGETASVERRDADYRKLLDDQIRSVATIARLKSERARTPTISVPDTLTTLAGKKTAEDLIQREQLVLNSRMGSLDAQLASNARARTAASEELNRLAEQRVLLDGQIEQQRKTAAEMTDLQKRGVVRAETVREAAFRLSDIEEKRTNTLVAIARVQSLIFSLESGETVIKSERSSGLDLDISRLEQKIFQNSVELAKWRSDSAKQSEFMIRYQIVRNGSVFVPDAKYYSELLPKDVLVVGDDGSSVPSVVGEK
ncbi:polysaccharide biosynthesis/export family protein [Aminobacter anthyllidis]|uniref:Polysaccharide biosynthesis/export family protein n=1 Tax=Aminobacter anthyllidis TaxID=1035067 RepID=A0A9X1AGY2_9HYPH|nr:polysaccharide biosynthesis/export family protein [Aminobacter anthyllidis]MBT1159336.1 polysaccharide biosynthesis/export family protein [Aminobacter anthyllidis]